MVRDRVHVTNPVRYVVFYLCLSSISFVISHPFGSQMFCGDCHVIFEFVIRRCHSISKRQKKVWANQISVFFKFQISNNPIIAFAGARN